MASGVYTHAYTHTHTHTLADESDYKKPGAPAAGRRAWFKNIFTAVTGSESSKPLIFSTKITARSLQSMCAFFFH